MSGPHSPGQHKLPLLVVDAPGGPIPQFYAPALLDAFDVHVVAVGASDDPAMQRRWRPLRAARSVVVVDELKDVRKTVSAQAAETGAHGVVAFSERVVHTAQLGALDAQLFSNSEATLHALRDKIAQRRMLEDASLPTPRRVVIADGDDAAAIPLPFPLPAVLKPAVGMGSVGITRVASREELGQAVRRVRNIVANDPRIAHPSPPLMLEEELLGDPSTTRGNTRGDYVSVEALTTSIGTQILAVQDKLPLARPFRENGHLMPTDRHGAELTAIIACARTALSALGVTFGATHTEIKLTPEGPRVIEINGRPGGGVCEMLALAADYNLALHLARSAVDAQYRPPTPRFHSFAAYLTPQPPEGRWRVEAAASTDDLLLEGAVSEVLAVQEVGAIVDSVDGTSSNLLRLLATAASQDELGLLGTRLCGQQFFRLRPAHTRMIGR